MSLSPAKKYLSVEHALLALTVCVHFAWVCPTHPATFASPDANGYLAQVPLIVEHGRTELGIESPLQYVGGHWLHAGQGKFYSRYPPGVAMVLAPFYALMGPGAALYVTPLLSSLTLVLLFLLCQPWIGPRVALLGAGLYALQPDANFHALNWGAHTHSAFFLLAGIVLFDTWSRLPTALWRPAVGGVCLGIVPAMRPAEASAGLGVAAFMLLLLVGDGGNRYRRGIVVAVLAAIVPLGALVWRNNAAFGGPLITGYSLTGEQQVGTGFAWEFFLDKWRAFFNVLMSRSGALFFALGVLGTAGMAAHTATRRVAVLILGAGLPVTLVYTAYYWGGGPTVPASGIRFLIPTLPLYVLPALWLLMQAGTNRRQIAALLGTLAVVQGTVWCTDGAARMRVARASLRRMAVPLRELRANVPEGAALIVGGELAATLQYYPYWLLLDAETVRQSRNGHVDRTGRRRGASRDSKPGAAPEQAGKMALLHADLAGLKGSARWQYVAKQLMETERRRPDGVFAVVETSAARAASREPLPQMVFPDGREFEHVTSFSIPDEPNAELHERTGPLPTQRADAQSARTVAPPIGPKPGSTLALYRLAAP